METCDGAFDTPIARDQKCDNCGKRLDQHEWFGDLPD